MAPTPSRDGDVSVVDAVHDGLRQRRHSHKRKDERNELAKISQKNGTPESAEKVSAGQQCQSLHGGMEEVPLINGIEEKLFGLLPLPSWRWLHEPENFYPASLSPHPDKSIHQVADSLFSSTSGFNNFTGFFNLCIILLILSNTRVALENVIKYGILIQPLDWMQIFLNEPYNWPSFMLVVLSNVFIFITFWAEVMVSKSQLSERMCLIIHTINLFGTITCPAVVIWQRHPFPLFSSICLAIYVVIFLKLISYIQTNGWCREAQRKSSLARSRLRYKSVGAALDPHVLAGRKKSAMMSDGAENHLYSNGKMVDDDELVQYPHNLNLPDIYYFMLTPTLCYELQFPRSARIRKRFLIKRVTEMLFLFGLMLGLIQQWIVPAVQNSRVPFQEMHLSKLLERVLKLAVPNHLIWLLFFYWFFHSCLNVLAEVIRFGDRTFYRDWWNAETISYFWQNWNIPVHRWASRHFYKPLLNRGVNRFYASIAVFFLSAFFHEYLVSVPLRMFRIWSFSAMLGQVPLAMFVTRYLNGRLGNMAVWLSLILGQPTAVLMYYHDYFILNLPTISNITASS